MLHRTAQIALSGVIPALALLVTPASIAPPALAQAPDAGENPREVVTTSVVVTLVDGSVIHGAISRDTVRLESDAGTFDIELARVETLERCPDGSAFITFRNGDRLSGSLDATAYVLQSILGEVRVPWSTVHTIEPVKNAMPEHALVMHIDFEQLPRLVDQGPQAFRVRSCGSVGRTDGPFGQAGVFNAGDWVDVMAPADSDAFPTSGAFTVSAWFMTEHQSDNAEQSILSTHSAGEGNDGFYFYIDHAPGRDGRVRWWVGPGVPGDFSAVSDAPVNDGEWHHVVGTYDGHETCLYLDGVFQDVKKVTGRPYYDQSPWWRIGHSVNNNAPWAENAKYQFHGAIDEVRFYRGVLDPATVRNLYATSRPDAG